MIKKLFIMSLILTSLVACAPKVEPIEEVVEEPEIEVFRNLFDGSIVENEIKEYKAFAIMIENTAAARPHYGLSKADVVYEVIKERFEETRFMAYFEGEFPEKVGNLRSIRVPFVRIYNEWHVALVHYGGAGENTSDDAANALGMLPDMYIPYRFDGVSGLHDEYFFRSSDRPSPHNAYIKLEEASSELPVMWPKKHFSYDEEEFSTSDDPATEIIIDYPTKSQDKVTYTFDEKLGKYERFINDKHHMDAQYDESIKVTNIIVQYAKHELAGDEGYVLVEFKYTGKADFFINGKHISGKWIKDFEDDVTHWITNDGEELVILPGNTWIQVVPDDLEISWK